MIRPEEIIVDLFAGGGGASEGIRQATGRHPDLAINHDPAAIRMHMENHVETEHRCESIYDVDPRQAVRGRTVGLLWASPSCTHFSRARGAVPVSRQLRGLGWMVRRWAGQVRPRLIMCENVPEWVTWGPVRRGRPWKARAGTYFTELVEALRGMGYAVEWRVLNAADYGTATSRRRLFLAARCDGEPIVWPAETHGPKGRAPHRAAAEVIDWSDLGASIFDRKKPLAPATCRRIAAGIVKYVLNRRPFLVQVGYGEAKGQAPRCMSVDAPLGTIVAGGCKHALCTVFLAKHYTGVIGQPADAPLGTITAVDHHALVTAGLTPIPEAANDNRAPLVAAFLALYYGSGGQHTSPADPLGTIVTKARHALVTVEIDGQSYAMADIRMRMLKPGELAAAQGFPAAYRLTGTVTEQIGRIGNSVCPPAARALVAANTNEPRPMRAAG